jgi:hypothetical protein
MILEVLNKGGHRDGELDYLDWSMAISNTPTWSPDGPP